MRNLMIGFMMFGLACAGAPAVKQQPRQLLQVISIGQQPSSFNEMELTVYVRAVNPTAQVCRIGSTNFKVEFDGKVLAESTFDAAVSVEQGETAELEWELPASWNLQGKELEDFLNRREVPIAITLTPQISGCPLSTESLVHNGVAVLPRVPEVLLEEATRAGFYRSEKVVNVTLEFALNNPNPFRIESNKVHYQVWLNEKPMGEGDLFVATSVDAASNTAFELPYDLSTANFGQEYPKVIREGKIHFRVQADYDLPPFKGTRLIEGDLEF